MTRWLDHLPGPAPDTLWHLLDHADREALLRSGTVRAMPRGTRLSTEGSPPDQVWVLLSGRVEVFRDDVAGHRTVLALLDLAGSAPDSVVVRVTQQRLADIVSAALVSVTRTLDELRDLSAINTHRVDRAAVELGTAAGRVRRPATRPRWTIGRRRRESRRRSSRTRSGRRRSGSSRVVPEVRRVLGAVVTTVLAVRHGGFSSGAGPTGERVSRRAGNGQRTAPGRRGSLSPPPAPPAVAGTGRDDHRMTGNRIAAVHHPAGPLTASFHMG